MMILTSFGLLRFALICLRGSRTIRIVPCDAKNMDFDVETAEGVNSIKFLGLELIV